MRKMRLTSFQLMLIASMIGIIILPQCGRTFSVIETSFRIRSEYANMEYERDKIMDFKSMIDWKKVQQYNRRSGNATVGKKERLGN